MKKTLIASFVILSLSSSAQDWGIGVRMGDPSGISIKKYLNGRNKHTSGKALEISFGRTHLLRGSSYYNKQFDWWNSNTGKYNEIDLLFYSANTPLGIQIHYLLQQNISNIGTENVRGLDWYYGFGGQLNTQTLFFTYRYKIDGNWVPVNDEKVTDISLGADGVIGLEYTFDDAPVSVFADLTLFMELVDNPFVFLFQSGLGVRYNF